VILEYPSASTSTATATDVARAAFYESAQSDLRVEGGSLPVRGDSRDTRARRILGEPSS
jgi:hypothetical protein